MRSVANKNVRKNYYNQTVNVYAIVYIHEHIKPSEEIEFEKELDIRKKRNKFKGYFCIFMKNRYFYRLFHVQISQECINALAAFYDDEQITIYSNITILDVLLHQYFTASEIYF